MYLCTYVSSISRGNKDYLYYYYYYPTYLGVFLKGQRLDYVRTPSLYYKYESTCRLSLILLIYPSL